MDMKPTSVQQLLDELKDEGIRGTVDAGGKSRAVVFVNSEDEEGITFTADECKLVLDSPGRITRLMDAISDVKDADEDEASICLFDVGVSDEVRDALERKFSAVDEG